MEPFRWLVRLSSGRQRNGHSHARPDSPIEKGSPWPRPSPICLSLSPFLPPSFAVWTSRAPAPRMSSWAGGKEGRRERPDGGRTDGPSHSTSEMARCTAFLPQVRRSRTFNGRRRREGGSNFPKCNITCSKREQSSRCSTKAWLSIPLLYQKHQ